MPKGVPNKRYVGEFKQMVVETITKEKLSYQEAERRFGLPYDRPEEWERIYLEKGPEGCILNDKNERRQPMEQ